MSAPKVFAISSKRFIYGKMAPRFSCHIIAKPLVKKLVRYYILVVGIIVLAVVLVHKFTKQTSRSIFHCPRYIVAHNYLAILIPRIRNTCCVGKKLHHLWGILKHFAGIRRISGLYVIIYLFVAPTVFGYCKIANGKHDGIDLYGFVHFPDIGAGNTIVHTRN